MAIQRNVAAIALVIMAALVLAIGVAIARALVLHNVVVHQIVGTSSLSASFAAPNVHYDM
jgi:hypothetical protein